MGFDECSDANVVFQKGIFLILSYEITKGPQALKAKPATAFPEIVYITVILRFLYTSNCSLNRLSL